MTKTNLKLYQQDNAAINSFEILPNGSLRVKATVAHSGDLIYHDTLGNQITQHVPTETIIDSGHLHSIAGLPVTLEHPPEKEINPDNYTKHAVGSTGDRVFVRKKEDISFVDVVMIVGDSASIQSIVNKEKTGVSLGYTVELRREDETHFTQLSRLCNHLAICSKPRAPMAKIHLDSGAINVDSHNQRIWMTNLDSTNIIKNPQKRWRILSITQ